MLLVSSILFHCYFFFGCTALRQPEVVAEKLKPNIGPILLCLFSKKIFLIKLACLCFLFTYLTYFENISIF